MRLLSVLLLLVVVSEAGRKKESARFVHRAPHALSCFPLRRLVYVAHVCLLSISIPAWSATS